MRDLARVYEFAFNGLNRFPGYLVPVPHIVDGPFELGGTTLTPLPVPHGKATVNGYLFSRGGTKLVAYLSDCSAVPDAIAEKIAGVKVLIIDALRPKPHPTHLSVAQALEVAAKVRAERTLFTHIAHELPQASEAELPAGVGIAYDGLIVCL
jgi:phosphoribosyl 1,2-cyclic phosphate phosphodiesterase